MNLRFGKVSKILTRRNLRIDSVAETSLKFNGRVSKPADGQHSEQNM
jgi:hypothetical protein